MGLGGLAHLHRRLIVLLPLPEGVRRAKLQGEAAGTVGQAQQAAAEELLWQVGRRQLILQLLHVGVP